MLLYHNANVHVRFIAQERRWSTSSNILFLPTYKLQINPYLKAHYHIVIEHSQRYLYANFWNLCNNISSIIIYTLRNLGLLLKLLSFVLFVRFIFDIESLTILLKMTDFKHVIECLSQLHTKFNIWQMIFLRK